jgi:hypothetical protein
LTYPQAAVQEAVVEEAFPVPSHSLVTDLVIDSGALTSLHYSQRHPQRQLVGRQVVSTVLLVGLQMVQLHCFATPVMEGADHTMLMACETAGPSKLNCKETLDIHSHDSENWIWILGFLAGAVEGVMTAGATLHHCRIS